MGTNSPPEKKKPDCFVHASASAIRRKRVLFNKEQRDILISYFQRNPYPDIKERKKLSKKITVDESRIQVWFQNRRCRRQKKQPSLASTNSRKWMHSENSPPSQIPKEDICKNDLSKQEFSTTGATCSGYIISQDHHLISSQTIRSSIELQLCILSRPVSQENSSQCASSWALQETQRPENHGTQTSFYGGVKSSFYCQQQVWTAGQLSSCYHPLTFQCAQEPPCQLQWPPAVLPLVAQSPTFQVQQLTSSPHQSPQEYQSQIQPPPLMRQEEQPNELPPSSNQQEHLQPINLCKRTVELGPTMLLPGGLLPTHPGDLDTTLRNLDDILRGLTFPLGHLTAQKLDDMYKQINDLLTVK